MMEFLSGEVGWARRALAASRVVTRWLSLIDRLWRVAARKKERA
jgi:hypothetical protein